MAQMTTDKLISQKEIDEFLNKVLDKNNPTAKAEAKKRLTYCGKCGKEKEVNKKCCDK